MSAEFDQLLEAESEDEITLTIKSGGNIGIIHKGFVPVLQTSSTA